MGGNFSSLLITKGEELLTLLPVATKCVLCEFLGFAPFLKLLPQHELAGNLRRDRREVGSAVGLAAVGVQNFTNPYS